MTTPRNSISIILTGSALAMAPNMAAASTSFTMYNTFGQGLHSVGTNKQGAADGIRAPWVGTATSTTLPFGFSGSMGLNWAVEIGGDTDAVEISTADALTRYNLDADIDTAKGAWFDGKQGWAHNTDYGLLRSSVDSKITITPSSVNNQFSNFGITIFTGMDVGATYDRHTAWNGGLGYAYDQNGDVYYYTATKTDSNPSGTQGLDYLTHSENGDISFVARANQIYTIALGGNDGKGNFGPHDGYVLNIQASPVPIPASIWMLGSGLIGLLGFGRRKQRDNVRL
ncbi:VPLPA-CTERM sorting domain-containing protein [Methylomonas sp. LL1]|uniref:VPLPA-CTERM sorting domain-containing protein n=1 Tax=Methylomonas sp. LL1 TaxID=2785785 RepID=UPI0018C3F02A|nr:VPLPA-CTERM sorting domain-containing protein [Methylomonas sp. LL1]QPK64598.1 VPLPA-CTERM sorting domain-containing protein [Methylomonas sp. LL1]